MDAMNFRDDDEIQMQLIRGPVTVYPDGKTPGEEARDSARALGIAMLLTINVVIFVVGFFIGKGCA